MILRRVWARTCGALNPGGVLSGLSPTFNLVHGPNEAGKSTFFRALLAVLYQRFQQKSDELLLLQPAGTELSAEVEVEFELPDGGSEPTTFLLWKRFFSDSGARLSERRGEKIRVLAENRAAEELVAQKLGSKLNARGHADATHRGMGEILLVDQGRLPIDLEGFSDLALGRLDSILRSVTTSSSIHRLLERVAREREHYLTEKGSKKKGSEVWRCETELTRVRLELDAVSKELETTLQLESELLGLRATPEPASEDRIQELKAIIAKANDDLLLAAGLESRLEKQREATGVLRATLQRTEKSAELCTLAARRQSEARNALLELARQTASTRIQREALKSEVLSARTRLETLEASSEGFAQEVAKARESHNFVRLTHQAAELKARLDAYDARHAEALGLKAEIESVERPSVTEVRAFEDHLGTLSRLEAEADAQKISVRVRALRKFKISHEDASRTLDAGDEHVLSGNETIRFAIEGLATVAVEGPRSEQQEAREKRAMAARHALETFRARFGVQDLDAARKARDAASELEHRRASALRVAESIFRDSAARAAAFARLEASEIALTKLSVAHSDRLQLDNEAATEANLKEAEAAQERHATALRDSRLQFENSSRLERESEAELLALERKVMESETQGREALAEIQALESPFVGKGGITLEMESQRRSLQQAVEAESTLLADLSKLGDASRRRNESEDALSLALRQRDERRERETRLVAVLDDKRKLGLHDRRLGLDIEASGLEAELSAALFESLAIDKLHQMLTRAQDSSLLALMTPVKARVSELLSRVTGEPAVASISEKGFISSLNAQGATVKERAFSAGTRDLLALLTRIACGELFVRSYGRHALVLDDPLVNCDRNRRQRILEILTEVSTNLQILIFTCHPDHYETIPKTARTISIDEARSAFESESQKR